VGLPTRLGLTSPFDNALMALVATALLCLVIGIADGDTLSPPGVKRQAGWRTCEFGLPRSTHPRRAKPSATAAVSTWPTFA
jgi:hypothetical protein